MTTLTRRAYRGDADSEAILELWLAASAAGSADRWPSPDALRAQLAAWPRGTDYIQLWEDRRRGGLVAVAVLLDERVLVWRTRAGAGDESLDAAIVAWALERAGRTGSHGEDPSLFVPVRDDDRRLTGLLERAGFQADECRTLRMERSLRAPIAAPQTPPEVVIRSVRDEDDVVAATALHNALFAGMRKTLGERKALAGDPGYRPGLDLLAVLADGAAAGYALGSCCVLERERLGHGVGWVEFVGVALGQRGRGLGRALTLHLLHAMRVEGLDTALLTTSAVNLAARRLFVACGFHTRHEIRWYVR